MANPKLTAAWFAKSGSDLRAGKYLLGAGDQFWGQIVFQCQQSAEKAIKGFLTFHSIRFAKTHNIAELLSLVSTKDQDLAKQLLDCEILSKYAVGHRYPSADVEPLTADMVNWALKTVEDCIKRLAVLCGITIDK